MALPQTIRVKLSSEAAESISLTPVVVQELAVRELMEHMLGVTGKDEARIRELLLRGTLVSGGVAIPMGGMGRGLRKACATLLATFPDPDPARGVRRRAIACARCCAADGRPSRFRGKPARARACSSARVFGTLLMEVVAGSDRGIRRIFVPGPRRPLLARVHPRRKRDECAPPATSVRYSTLREQIRTRGVHAGGTVRETRR